MLDWTPFDCNDTRSRVQKVVITRLEAAIVKWSIFETHPVLKLLKKRSISALSKMIFSPNRTIFGCNSFFSLCL